MDIGPVQEVKAVSLSRKMSKVGLLAAMKTFTKPHFQRKKKSKEKHQSRSWDSGLCHVGLPSPGQSGLGTVGSYKKIYWTEPNKDKTEHSNGSVPSGDGGGGGGVVNHSPKSCGMLSPGSGAPPGSVALPGLTGHRGHDNGVSVTVSNGNSYNGTRTVYSPEADSPPTPQPPPAPGSAHHHRPVSLNSVKGGAGKSGGKRTRWLLCYHMGGGAPSASPSPPSEHGNSQCSTPSPTDHGFKLPNSFSNERPTSLPVALLNCSGSSAGQPDTVVGRGVVGEFLSFKLPGYQHDHLHSVYISMFAFQAYPTNHCFVLHVAFVHFHFNKCTSMTLIFPFATCLQCIISFFFDILALLGVIYLILPVILAVHQSNQNFLQNSFCIALKVMYMSKHSNFPNGLSTLKGSQPEGLEQDKTLPFCTASLHLFF